MVDGNVEPQPAAHDSASGQHSRCAQCASACFTGRMDLPQRGGRHNDRFWGGGPSDSRSPHKLDGAFEDGPAIWRNAAVCFVRSLGTRTGEPGQIAGTITGRIFPAAIRKSGGAAWVESTTRGFGTARSSSDARNYHLI